MTHRQSHHAREAAVDVSNRMKLWMLDRIRTRLVERVASLHICQKFFVRVVAHRHVGHAEIFEEESIAKAKQGNPGVDLMSMPAQTLEHRGRLVCIDWLT